MTLIQGDQPTLKNVTQRYPKVIVIFYREDCPLCLKLLEDFKRYAESKFYKELQFVAIITPALSNTGKMITLGESPYFECYNKGGLIDFQSVETKNELLYVIKNLVMMDS